jgi:urease accessory protein
MGRAVVRAAAASWPGAWEGRLRAEVPDGPLHPIALGAAGRAAGLEREGAALATAHGTVTTPATAAVRLLGLDPFAVTALLARLASEIEAVADAGVRAGGDWRALPAASAPLLDIGAERHAAREVRLFAS